jgi:hypothetical protein
MSIKTIEQVAEKPWKLLRELDGGCFFKYNGQICIRCGEITSGINGMYYVRYFDKEEITGLTALRADTRVVPVKIKEIIYEV